MAKKIIIIIIALFTICHADVKSQDYKRLWSEYDQSQAKGLHRTSLTIAGKIYDFAKEEHNMPQLFKAYLCKAKLNEKLLPGSIYADLLEFENWAKKETDSVDVALANAILANLYMQYYRTKSQETNHLVVSNERLPLAEWTKEMILQRVDTLMHHSLMPVNQLQHSSTLKYDPFAEQGIMSCYFNHDLYHAIAFTAIETYRGLVHSYYYNDGFATQRIAKIYKQLLSSYSDNPEASLLLQLSFLKFNRNLMDEVSYLSTLDRFISDYQHCETVAEVYLAKAEHLMRKDKFQEAYKLSIDALKLHPKYCRIAALEELRNTLLTPMISLKCDEVIYPRDSITLTLNFKNISQASIKLFNNKKQLMQQRRLFLSSTVAKSDTTLFLSPLPCGKYSIQLESRAFKKSINKTFYVSGLKMLNATLPDNKNEFLLVDYKTGAPIDEGEISIYNEKKELLRRCETDSLGAVVLDLSTFNSSSPRYYFRLTKGVDNALPMFLKYIYSPVNHEDSDVNKQKASETIKIITDRTLYQSGQKIEIKGIVEEQQGVCRKVVAQKSYLLSLTHNSQVFYEQKVTTNTFGSFYLSIPLSDKLLNGEYQIEINGEAQATVNVISYRRPSYKIAIDKPQGEYQVNDTLRLTGTIATYSGLPISVASLEYKVFCTSFNNWRNLSYTLIGSHDITVDKKGQFIFNVPLIPSADPKANNYLYTIQVKGVDHLGEVQVAECNYAFGQKSVFIREKLLKQLNNKTIPLPLEVEVCNANREKIDKVVYYQLLEKSTDTVVESGELAANTEHLLHWDKYPSGRYQLLYSVKDKKMNTVKEVKEIVLFSPLDQRPVVKSPQWFYLVNDRFDAAHKGEFYFGTSFKNVYLRVTVMDNEKVLNRKIIQLSDTICHFQYPYKVEYGTGISVNLMFLHNGKEYSKTLSLTRRELNQRLVLKWASFRDKITPNHDETWSLKVQDENKQPVQAEVLAMMYDASLEALGNREQTFYLPKSQFYTSIYWQMLYPNVLRINLLGELTSIKVPKYEYDHFYLPMLFSPPILVCGYSNKLEGDIAPLSGTKNETMTKSEQIDLRDNFEETAFFYPQLRSDSKGEVDFSFRVPGAMTQWNFRAFAHTKDGKRGELRRDDILSQKSFAIRPYLPHFVRVGDCVTVRALLTNLTALSQDGKVTFELFNPINGEYIERQTVDFKLCSSQQKTMLFAFSLKHYIPQVACRVIAETDNFSDGEQHLIAVVNNSEEVEHTYHQSFSANSLSDTVRVDNRLAQLNGCLGNSYLTLQFYNGLLWPAIKTLPHLNDMESPELIGEVSSFFSNFLAQYLMTNNNEIASKIDSITLQFAADEEDQKEHSPIFSSWPYTKTCNLNASFGDFFKYNGLNGRAYLALERIKEGQNDDGSFSWVKGMANSRQLTLWVLTQFSHLNHLTHGHLFENQSVCSIKERAFDFLKSYYTNELSDNQDKLAQLTSNDVSYLYLLAEEYPKVIMQKDTCVDKLYELLVKSCYQLDIEEKAKAAIIFSSCDNSQLAQQMINSVKEYLSFKEGYGCYIPALNAKGRTTQKSLSTHLSVMEALLFVEGKNMKLREMSRWLMSQKSAMLWGNKGDTLDAIYILLKQGLSEIEDDFSFSLSQNGRSLELINATYQMECNDGFCDAPIVVKHASADLSGVVMTLSAQMPYEKIKTHASQRFDINKKGYIERSNGDEVILLPLSESKVKKGDILVYRLIINVKQPADYIVITDNYSAALEPYDYNSCYAYNDGLGYYKEVKEGEVKFYIDQLSVGAYLLEERFRVVRQGEYNSGIVLLQSATSPHYRSYYQSTSLSVDE